MLKLNVNYAVTTIVPLSRELTDAEIEDAIAEVVNDDEYWPLGKKRFEELHLVDEGLSFKEYDILDIYGLTEMLFEMVGDDEPLVSDPDLEVENIEQLDDNRQLVEQQIEEWLLAHGWEVLEGGNYFYRKK